MAAVDHVAVGEQLARAIDAVATPEWARAVVDDLPDRSTSLADVAVSVTQTALSDTTDPATQAQLLNAQGVTDVHGRAAAVARRVDTAAWWR